MKLTSALLMILLWALVSGPALARGGHSFGQSGAPMFQGGHFHSSARSGFAAVRNGRFHRHFHSGVVIIGAPFFAPFYYPYPYSYPYYYYPPDAAMPYLPPQYIEQGEAAPEQSQGYWYYCADAKAYYPYVKDCPGGWQQVLPQPSPVSNY